MRQRARLRRSMRPLALSPVRSRCFACSPLCRARATPPSLSLPPSPAGSLRASLPPPPPLPAEQTAAQPPSAYLALVTRITTVGWRTQLTLRVLRGQEATYSIDRRKCDFAEVRVLGGSPYLIYVARPNLRRRRGAAISFQYSGGAASLLRRYRDMPLRERMLLDAWDAANEL